MPRSVKITAAVVLFVAASLCFLVRQQALATQEILATPPDELPGMVVMYHASYCPPCRRMKPLAQQARAEGYRIRLVDVGAGSSEAEAANIRSIPTFVYYRDGKEQMRKSGVMSYAWLTRFCRGIR